MAKISFEVSARAGKLFGRENFSNPEGAIIELVKNSYDADAKTCIVLFDIPICLKKDSDGKEYVFPVKEKSIIYIIDNGEGMTKAVIEDHWMKIGTGNKEKDFLSDDKRVKTGAKGIGRFALDRLGFETEMWTLSKNRKDKIGSHWKMDWNQFDNPDKSISQIEAELEPIKLDLKEQLKNITSNNKISDLIKLSDFKNGTILKITNLKDEWFDKETNEVFRSLESLIPPKELNIPFEVYFHHVQQPVEYGKVETAFFNDYDYKLKAKYNSETFKVDFEITRNELDIKLIKKNFPDVLSKAEKPFDMGTIAAKTFTYSKSIDKILKRKIKDKSTKLWEEVGSFELVFYYLKYSNSLKEGYPFKKVNASERRSVLDKFGGVKVYRDSFRVRPYGDPTNDWLKLGSRVAQSPAGAGQRIGDWRVRPEQTAGIITISRKSNPLLVDKSDRGALQENDAFDTFKKIIVGVIHEFEFDRTKMINPFYRHNKKLQAKIKEQIIQKRAEELANLIVENRKDVEQSVYGESNQISLFQQKQEEEERKTYQETFKSTFKAIDEENAQKENEELVQIRALASLGLIVSSFAHELKEVRNNSTQIRNFEKIFKTIVSDKLKKSIEYEDGLDIIDLLTSDNEKIRHWVDYSLTAIKKDKRKRGEFIFSTYLSSLETTWEQIFNSKEIELHIEDSTIGVDYDFRAFEMDMLTIFTNLINNSLDSFENLIELKEKSIIISCKLVNESIEIIYSDNGVGLDDVFDDKEEIFLPFVTAKKDKENKNIGIGLGMYLVKEVIDNYAGSIEILEPDSGFSVLIKLPIRKT